MTSWRSPANSQPRRAATSSGSGGVAWVHGHQGIWDIDAATLESAKRALWNKSNLFIDEDMDGTGSGSHAIAELVDRINIDIDLSSLRVGELFATHVTLLAVAVAVDERVRESTVEAYIDPQGRIVAAGVAPHGFANEIVLARALP